MMSAEDGIAGITDGTDVGVEGGPVPAVACIWLLNAVTRLLWSDLN